MKDIEFVSYIGKPQSDSAMFITKKVEHLLVNLHSVVNCLIFCEDSISIPEELANKHSFICSKNPQYEYAEFIRKIDRKKLETENNKKYTLQSGGYYLGENTKIEKSVVIEPLCLIGHGVCIGENTRVLSGAIIKNSVIGKNVLVNENATIGTNGFTMALDQNGNRVRIPTLGKVIIGDNVEVGMLANIAVGSAGNTIIHDNVKIDAYVHVAHDVELHKNVELPAGVIIGGFDVLYENVFVGINASLRNRIEIGANSVVGMGSVVTKSIPENSVFVGNPARPLEKKE